MLTQIKFEDHRAPKFYDQASVRLRADLRFDAMVVRRLRFCACKAKHRDYLGFRSGGGAAGVGAGTG